MRKIFFPDYIKNSSNNKTNNLIFLIPKNYKTLFQGTYMNNQKAMKRNEKGLNIIYQGHAN